MYIRDHVGNGTSTRNGTEAKLEGATTVTEHFDVEPDILDSFGFATSPSCGSRRVYPHLDMFHDQTCWICR